jgi:Class II flagellar assembly regulator
MLSMRIYGPNGAALATAPIPARRSPSGTFAVAEAGVPQPQSAAVALRTLGGIDALIALQGVEDPVERRRRAVKHGRRALDALDELKLGLLAGTLDQGTMLRLKSAAADLKHGSGDEKLDSVLAEIDLRVEVELAKGGIS